MNPLPGSYISTVRKFSKFYSLHHAHNLTAPDPKKIGSGESQYKKVWCHQNFGGTNQIFPRPINDVTFVIEIVLVTIIRVK